MWMCDFCRALNDDAASACPKCGRVRETARAAGPPIPPQPSFSSHYSPDGVEQAPPTTIVDTGVPSPPPPQQAPYGWSGGSQPSQPQFGAPPSTAQPPSPSPPGQHHPPPHYAPTAQPAQNNGLIAGAAIGALLIAGLLRMLNVGRLIFLAVGIGCIVGGNYLKHSSEKFKATAVQTTGTVVKLDQSGSGDDLHYYPVVDFKTAAGNTVEVRSSMGSRPPDHHVGDSVKVYYNQQSPNDAVIESAATTWLPMALMIFGWIFALAAVFGRTPSSG